MLLQPHALLSVSAGDPATGQRLRVGAAHDEWNHVAIALVAMHEGYFAAEGLTDVELVSYPETSGELMDREDLQLDLLARGVIDIAIDPRTSLVLEASDQGKPVCIIAARRKNHAFVLMGQSGLNSVQDLRGLTVDMGNRGGAPDAMLRELLKDNALEPDEDVRFVYSGGPMHGHRDTIEAFRAGKRGPVSMANTRAEVERLTSEGFAVLADLAVIYPSRHDRVTAGNERFVLEHPDVVKAFLKGMIRACNYVLDPANRDRFIEIIRAGGFLGTDEQQRNYDNLFESWEVRVSRDLTLPREGIDRIVLEEQRAGNLPRDFQVEDILRLGPLVEAQRELGLEPEGVPA